MQCGADVLSGDPLGNFNLTPTGASLCVRHMLQWRLPTILLGGGGKGEGGGVGSSLSWSKPANIFLVM